MSAEVLKTKPADDLVAGYIKLRDIKEALAKKQREEMRRITAPMELVELELLRRLNEDGAESTRTEHGTFYKTVRTSATVKNWDATLAFIVENELWELLEHRVSKKVVEDYIEEHQVTPPGVDITRDVRVNIRR